MTIPSGFKPILAIDSDKISNLKFPVLVSPKLNGIRCIVFGGIAYSRSLKPLPNKSIQQWVAENADVLEGLDGEIVAGDDIFAENALNLSTSLVMSQDKVGEFSFCVFDKYHPTDTYHERYTKYIEDNQLSGVANLIVVQHFKVSDQSDLDDLEQRYLAIGAEGLMIRSLEGKYKHGRSGKINPELIKVKRFVDDQFEIVGYEEKMHNANEAKTNELGRTERSTSKENLVPMGTLGALVLKTPEGYLFNCGTGFDDKMRDDLWKIKDELIGQYAKIEYFPKGMENVPLLPVFIQIRNPIDMD